MTDAERLGRALAAIDAANADDPNELVVGGVRRPKEVAHAEMMTAWVQRLDPDADEAQLLAARANHLRRWEMPRSSYPDGRAGYLRWRREAERRHALEVATILERFDYPSEIVERVGAIIRKDGLGSDPAVQTHEDALCLVFLETQFDDLADRLDDEKMIRVLQRTARKMSPAALAAVGELPLSSEGALLLERALSDQDG